ncbi:hypothetical protein ASG57_36035 [Bradyrhizobium sp. Leaf396]|nr:hypothetical protein ASG57_36035 [Bradyrhizobium sp. Leaf396]
MVRLLRGDGLYPFLEEFAGLRPGFADQHRHELREGATDALAEPADGDDMDEDERIRRGDIDGRKTQNQRHQRLGRKQVATAK